MGITRFNTLGDLNRFLKSYESEKEDLLFRIERDYDIDLEILETKERVLQNEYDEVKKSTKKRLNRRLNTLREKCTLLASKPAKNAVMELAYWYQLQFFLGYKFILEKAIPLIIRRRTRLIKKQLTSVQTELYEFISKKQKIISKRSASQFEKLSHTKNVVYSLNTLVAGAIGEHLVEKELKKLNGPFVLINDFSLAFKKPIFWRQKNDLDLPIWNMVLQKILTVYYPEKFIAMGSSDVLLEFARDIELGGIELEPDNAIEISYEGKRVLDAIEELKGWDYWKLGVFIWEVYNKESKRDYYILGSKYGENNTEDIFPEMLEESAIAIGFALRHVNLEEPVLWKKTFRDYRILKDAGRTEQIIQCLKTLPLFKTRG